MFFILVSTYHKKSETINHSLQKILCSSNYNVTDLFLAVYVDKESFLNKWKEQQEKYKVKTISITLLLLLEKVLTRNLQTLN